MDAVARKHTGVPCAQPLMSSGKCRHPVVPHPPLTAAMKPAREQATSGIDSCCCGCASAVVNGVEQVSAPVSICHHFKKPSAPPDTTSVPLWLKAMAVSLAPCGRSCCLQEKAGGPSNTKMQLSVAAASFPLLDRTTFLIVLAQEVLHRHFSWGCQLLPCSRAIPPLRATSDPRQPSELYDTHATSNTFVGCGCKLYTWLAQDVVIGTYQGQPLPAPPPRLYTGPTLTQLKHSSASMPVGATTGEQRASASLIVQPLQCTTVPQAIVT